MAEVIGARLKELIKLRRTNQSAVAAASGMTQPSIARLIDGSTRETGKLLELARALQTSPEYLVGETDDPEISGRFADRRLGFKGLEPEPPEEPLLDGMVMVKEADLVLGFGGTFLDSPVEERMIPFPKDWLRQFSDAPVENLVFIRGRGESMKPTVLDGDICLLDLGRKRLDEQDELWAVAYGNIGMVKRLRGMPDGTVKIMSDNPVVGEEVAGDGELFIIGRCCGVFRKT